MTAVVVRVGKANADANKTERHDGDGDQTFHLICSIAFVVSGKRLARLLAQVRRLDTPGHSPLQTCSSHAETRSEGVAAPVVGRTVTTVPRPSEQRPEAMAASTPSEQRRAPGPYSTSACTCRMSICGRRCSTGSHRPRRSSTSLPLRHQALPSPPWGQRSSSKRAAPQRWTEQCA